MQFHIIGTNLTIVPSTAIDWSPAQPAVTKWARTARLLYRDNRGRGQTSYKSGRTVLHFGPAATITTTLWFNYSNNAELRSCARFLLKAGGPNRGLVSDVIEKILSFGADGKIASDSM